MKIRDQVIKMKEISPYVASVPIEIRNNALRAVSAALSEHKAEIFSANKNDLERAENEGIPGTVKKRLVFDEHKLSDCLKGIDNLISLPDPVGCVTLKKELDEGLLLERVTVPIGVIGIIFEARPDALIQISCLCVKSGNCAVLKGGKETASTNEALFRLIHQAVIKEGIPELCLIQASEHSEIDELLECDDCVDLLIPRGSNAFVRYIMDNTKIPVMGHSEGICHIYVDDDADFDMAIPIIVDAKTQYAAACNAAETLLINRKIAKDFLPRAAVSLMNNGVKLRGTREASDILETSMSGINSKKENYTPPHTANPDNHSARGSASGCISSMNAKNNKITGDVNNSTSYRTIQIADDDIMRDEDFYKEYLDLVISVKLVGSVEEAAHHINCFGSHHTDCIITNNAEHAKKFMALVDSAGVYQNCSTRFADGFRYGFGAEVGISTGKLHARGPVGLEGLVTYKYHLYGNGQTVGEYASGRKTFHFKNLL